MIGRNRPDAGINAQPVFVQVKAEQTQTLERIALPLNEASAFNV